jgi:predicted kinase
MTKNKKPVLILINGMPGVGKTTLLRKLRSDLNLPGIGKDDIKELLFENMGIGDFDWSKDLGAATADMVFALIETWVGLHRSLIIESAFYKTFASDRVAKIIAANDILFVELYCKTDPVVRAQRFAERVNNGTRHAGHADVVGDVPEAELKARYAPLEVGTSIEIDTTNFGEEHYQKLLNQLRKLMDY